MGTVQRLVSVRTERSFLIGQGYKAGRAREHVFPLEAETPIHSSFLQAYRAFTAWDKNGGLLPPFVHLAVIPGNCNRGYTLHLHSDSTAGHAVGVNTARGTLTPA